jgi:hypothetical protein
MIPVETLQPVKSKQLLFRINIVIALTVNITGIEMFYHNLFSTNAVLPSDRSSLTTITRMQISAMQLQK